VEGGDAEPRVPGRFRCVMASMLNEQKGHLEAVDAVAGLIREGLDIELLIAGAAPYPEQARRVEQRIADSGAGDRIRLLGRREQVLPLIASADCLLMCSRCEAFGRCTAEALLLGTPVVGSRAGGTLEMVRDHETGLLYEPGNASDLARKIRYLVEHPDERASMGAKARNWAARAFAPAVYRDAMVDAFEAAMNPQR